VQHNFVFVTASLNKPSKINRAYTTFQITVRPFVWTIVSTNAVDYHLIFTKRAMFWVLSFHNHKNHSSNQPFYSVYCVPVFFLEWLECRSEYLPPLASAVVVLVGVGRLLYDVLVFVGEEMQWWVFL
jgi:hypothetical protein